MAERLALGKRFLKSDQIGGLIWLGLGIYMCLEAVAFQLGDFHKPGPGFTPFLTGASLVIFGLVLIFFVGPEEPGQREGTKPEDHRAKENRKTLFFTFLTFVGYILVFERLGSSLSTFIFFFLLFKFTDPKRWLMPSVLSASAVILSYLVFSVWLKPPLP